MATAAICCRAWLISQSHQRELGEDEVNHGDGLRRG